MVQLSTAKKSGIFLSLRTFRMLQLRHGTVVDRARVSQILAVLVRITQIILNMLIGTMMSSFDENPLGVPTKNTTIKINTNNLAADLWRKLASDTYINKKIA